MAIQSGLRVLVIDDHHDSAYMLARLLKAIGQDARACYSGAEGLEEMDRFQPHIVLVDLLMPAMDGYEVARRIRQRLDHRHVSVIAVSGYAPNGDRPDDDLFAMHILKPVPIETLQQLLNAYCDSSVAAAA